MNKKQLFPWIQGSSSAGGGEFLIRQLQLMLRTPRLRRWGHLVVKQFKFDQLLRADRQAMCSLAHSTLELRAVFLLTICISLSPVAYPLVPAADRHEVLTHEVEMRI